ncbi:hypothetical protein J1N35_015084 [Gossypium stocksii]|uniref:Uncharacterized protein n=1 Tax=Gossypium stocksii TaxID=47602 RepID=A0A9D4A891_9ROSI|nr:hypothetical protein J1N35_015084 [Gossypium stocksii]
MVADYSSNNGFSSVNWSEFFTRTLLDREVVMLRRFEDMVRSMELVPDVEDRLSWVHDSNEEFTESSWWICLYKCRFDTIKTRSSSSIWCLPPQGCLKFNACGIANEEVTSCGGVLRDMEGVARALFSGPIAANNTDSTEAGAMFITLDLFLSMG